MKDIEGSSAPASRLPATWPLVALILLLLGLGLRLYDLTDQPIDFHPTRQLRGAIVARGMYYAMLPSVDEETRKQAIAFQASTGQYEPPILERLVALTYLAAGKEIFWVARIYNSLFWLIGGITLAALASGISAAGEKPPQSRRPVGSGLGWPAIIALAYYLVLPFSVQASRSFQPDPAMVVWMILAWWSLYYWCVGKLRPEEGASPARLWKWAILAGAFAGMAILTKAVALYTMAGAMIVLVLYTHWAACQSQTWRLGRAFFDALRDPQVWSMAALAVGPVIVYYLARQERASEYFSSWTVSLSHLLIEPLFYLRWLKLIAETLTPVALLLALVGVFFARGLSRALLVGLWTGYLLYGLFFPYQMNTHNYYHLQLVPIVALSMVPAAQVAVHWLSSRKRLWQWVAAGLAVLVLAVSSWQALVPLYGADYRNEPAYWQEIASYLPEEGKIIALTQDYGYRLMYYGWRKVTLWPNRGEIKLSILRGSDKDFEEFFAKRTEGKRYFLITAFKQFDDQPELKDMLAQNFPILAQGPGYVIFDLGNR